MYVQPEDKFLGSKHVEDIPKVKFFHEGAIFGLYYTVIFQCTVQKKKT